MAIQGIEGVLQQMQAMAIQAGNNGQNSVPQGVSFASELTAALGKSAIPSRPRVNRRKTSSWACRVSV